MTADKEDASGRVSASLDVNQVKDKLEAVEKRQADSKKSRITVDKELANAANNTKKIEEVRCSFFFASVLFCIIRFSLQHTDTDRLVDLWPVRKTAPEILFRQSQA